MMWGALWDSVREGELDPGIYVELALRNLPVENDESSGVGPRTGNERFELLP
jgi:hypothetical protein